MVLSVSFYYGRGLKSMIFASDQLGLTWRMAATFNRSLRATVEVTGSKPSKSKDDSNMGVAREDWRQWLIWSTRTGIR
jgi:hypothetical protein